MSTQICHSRWPRLRRNWSKGLPAVTWVAAIVAVVWLAERSAPVGDLTGYAQDTPIVLAHYEPRVVRQVHVELFEQVSRGQVLVSLHDSQERIELAAIEKDIERLKAAVLAERERIIVDNARATADSENLVRRFAMDREDARLAYLSECVVDAQQQALLRGRRFEYETVCRLVEQGDAPLRELNNARTEVEALDAAIGARAEVLARARQSFEEADRRWQAIAARPEVQASAETVLAPVRLAVDVRTRELEDVVRRIEANILRAPIDGHIASVDVRSGDHVLAGALLVSITPSSTSEVIAYLPERLAMSVRAGDHVTATCVASTAEGPRCYSGQVTRLAPGVTEVPLRYRPLPTYPVWGRGVVIALSNGVRVIPGEAVRISFLGD